MDMQKMQMLESMKSLLSNDYTLMYNKTLAENIGLYPAILYQTLLSKNKHWVKEGKLGEQGYFYATLPHLADWTCITEHHIKKARDVLVDRGLIEYKLMGMPAKGYFKITNNVGALLEILQPNTDADIDSEIHYHDVPATQNMKCPTARTCSAPHTEHDVADAPLSNKHIVISKSNNKKVIQGNPSTKQNTLIKAKPKTTSNTISESTVREYAKEAISYLNTQAGKNFSITAKTNLRYIKALLKELNPTQAEIRHVIDVKVEQWKGDSKMDAYLRPETLFRPSKFETYKNEKLKRQLGNKGSNKHADNQGIDKAHLEQLRQERKGSKQMDIEF